MIYLQLFYEFFKTGLFIIGGALAAIPFLQEMSVKTGWFTLAELTDMIAVSESTPGPIGINMATYVGYKTAGIPGGIVASIGLILPSVIIVMVVAGLLRKFRDNRTVNAAFYGLRPASCGLIAAVGLGMLRMALMRSEVLQQTGAFLGLFDFNAVLLAAVLFVVTNNIKTHPVFYIAGSALVGIVLKF